MSNDLTRLTAAQLSAGLRAGEYSSEDVTRAHLDRIEQTDSVLGSFLTVEPEQALATARDVDSRRAAGEELHPYAGVPVSVKDVVVTEGIRTTAASRILEDWIPPYDATISTRIKDAGLPILGKTNMDEFAMGSSTENSAYGPTHNPWDLSRTAGGSGGGSSAALASGMAPLAIGTDTGGSIRQPAALTNTVGVKPTYGTVSRYGLVACASSLDQGGPTGRTVLDTALLHEVIAGHDANDSTSSQRAVAPVVEAARQGSNGDLSGVKIGVVKQLQDVQGMQSGVQESYQASLAQLTSQGAEIVEVDCPSFEYALNAYYLILPCEVSSNLARFDGMRYGQRRGDDGHHSADQVMSMTRAEGFGPEVKRRIILGTYALSAGYYDAWYGSAQKVRTLIIQDFNKAFEQADVLISPTSPSTAFKFGEKMDDPLAMYMNDIATIPANLAGTPAMSIPSGLSDDGLPAGIQFIAPQQRDEVMYKPAAALEAALNEQWGGPIWQSLKTPWLDGLNK